MQLYLAAVLQILSMCPFFFMWCLILQDGLEHPCNMTAGLRQIQKDKPRVDDCLSRLYLNHVSSHFISQSKWHV